MSNFPDGHPDELNELVLKSGGEMRFREVKLCDGDAILRRWQEYTGDEIKIAEGFVPWRKSPNNTARR